MVRELDIIREIMENLPPELNASMSTLITILQTLGVIFIIYLVFLIVRIFFDIRSKLMIRKTYEKVNEIDEKLNKLLPKKGKRK
jgi:uncharacterized membrane protein YciS (DUF1049 family)